MGSYWILYIASISLLIAMSRTFAVKINGLDTANHLNLHSETDTKRTAAKEEHNAIDADKRGSWSDKSMRVWGKRNDEIGHLDDKRQWNQGMRVWGKRDNALTPDKKWGKHNNNMRVWGKRDDSDEKRGWDRNNMRVWGKRDDNENQKRAWGDSGVRVWGKRAKDTEESHVENLDETNDADKRSWKNNNMRVWGKRAETDLDKAGLHADKSQEEKRWNSNKMRVWGKRADEENEDSDTQLEGETKRGWGGKSMRVWGKRDSDQPSEAEMALLNAVKAKSKRHIRSVEPDKRAWSTGSMRAWGKRWRGPKRSWKTNVMRVWGKRNFDNSNLAPWTADEEDFADRPEVVDYRDWRSLPSLHDLLLKESLDSE